MRNPDVERVLASASDEVRDLAGRTRALVLDVLPAGIIETVDGTDIGYGWAGGYKGLICVIGVHARWVNLGLADGAALPDPNELMQGRGKRHRFVRIGSAADLDRAGLRDLLEASCAAHPRLEG